MSRAKYIMCVLALMCTGIIAGQTRSYLREMFVSAEGDILFEDYAEALPKYLNLLQIFPDNYNFYYRIGQCYLNMPGEKEKSIPYLETAVKNINRGYRKGKFRETGAPYDALYMLANAYRIHNDLDKALEIYDLFMREVDPEVYDTNLVRFQIQTCHNAREMMRKPVYVVEKNLGSIINGRFSDFNPVISADEKVMLFTRELQFYDAVFGTVRSDGQWSEPVNLTPQLGVDQDYYTSSLSADGKTLVLYRIDTYDGNLYISRKEGNSWSKVEKLNANVNTKYWESHGTITRDGRKIYFTSNRKESLGGLDIFVCERDSLGDWGPAVNLGPLINTGYNEETPFLANNDRTLFFSSRGHYNMGGYDIFRTDMNEKGEWGVPVNLGYPVNTTDDNLFYVPLETDHKGLMAKFSSDGFGRMDIFSYEIFSDRHPRNFFVTGKAAVRNLLGDFSQPVSVTAFNNADASRSITTMSNPATGVYSFNLPHGSFTFTFSSDDALTLSQKYDMPLTYRGDTIQISPVSLEPSDYRAYLKVLSDPVVKVHSADPVNIDLLAEEMSILNIDIHMADSVIISERHKISDSTFTFTMTPIIGENHIIFRLTDRFGNDTSASVTVIRAGREIPLYREIIRPPGSAETEGAGLTQAEAVKADTISSVAGEAYEEVTAGKERTVVCRLWWTLVAVAVIILLFIVWKRRRRKKE